MSHNSFASIVSYNLNGNYFDSDLNGLIAFESVGIPRPESMGSSSGYVDFKIYDFFLVRDNNEVFIQHNVTTDKIQFMASGITDGFIKYSGDRCLDIRPYEVIFYWITEVPEDGSLIFAPNAFDLSFYSDYYLPNCWILHAISTVDESGAFTFLLYGFFAIFLIKINSRLIVNNP